MRERSTPVVLGIARAIPKSGVGVAVCLNIMSICFVRYKVTHEFAIFLFFNCKKVSFSLALMHEVIFP
jgi:hypothetical protein